MKPEYYGGEKSDEKKPALTALGELLIDFTPVQTGYANPCFEQNPGGAPANVLAAFSKLGGQSSFIGAVGKDSFGNFLEQTLVSLGVDISGLVKVSGADTTLAFVHLSKSGDRSFSFYRRPGADTCLTREDISAGLLVNCDIFHFGSLSLTGEPARSATLFAAEEAKKLNKIISFDPNWREPLWPDRESAISQMKAGVKLADVIKVSNEEALMITGEDSIETAAEYLLAEGPALVIVTMGPEGCFFCHKNGRGHVPAFEVTVADTTGAGDAFWGAFLFKLGEKYSADTLSQISAGELKKICGFGNAAGALAASRRGAIPSLGTSEEILALYSTGSFYE
ncbi:carbohydrate kinase [Brucepastera parasyntrophica]|uniref:carbohydrate kinase family protein n=1 Tax=Brucepastera parasyntrophica TaxID=2880008 RepID=UPI00210E0F92|nr:carbohydrate kinase [Brucepastera parasyntrophica]ULQ59156.1 carbohydrate kinase [Brucepastera parasyntrophica]